MRKLLLQLGRMVPRKGIDNVIRSLATLKRAKRAQSKAANSGGE
jgi:glycosyltransferase involved in cell wall biosynthesis